MSRSRRKTPITGNTTAESEKYDKRLANRAFRAKMKSALKKEKEPLKNKLESGYSTWDFAKDGKQYLHKETLQKYPDLMRK